MPKLDYRGLAWRMSATVLRGYWGRRFTGTVGLLWDSLSESARQAVRASWIGDTVGPAYDAMPALGREYLLPRYPVESWGQHHERLKRAWDDWPYAGDESSILGQLTAAGFPGARILTAREWPTVPPTPWWSQFWVYFPIGTHHVTGVGPAWGSFTYGDGTHYGVSGLTQAEIYTLRAIVKKFKPGHWVCRGIVFELTAPWVYGDGSNYGDPGLVWGGSSASITV